MPNWRATWWTVFNSQTIVSARIGCRFCVARSAAVEVSNMGYSGVWVWGGGTRTNFLPWPTLQHEQKRENSLGGRVSYLAPWGPTGLLVIACISEGGWNGKCGRSIVLSDFPLHPRHCMPLSQCEQKVKWKKRENCFSALGPLFRSVLVLEPQLLTVPFVPSPQNFVHIRCPLWSASTDSFRVN